MKNPRKRRQSRPDLRVMKAPRKRRQSRPDLRVMKNPRKRTRECLGFAGYV